MMKSKKAMVSIGLVLGALGVAATASALGAAEDPGVGEPTTTVEGPTTRQVPTTAEPTDTTDPTTTTVPTATEPTTTVEAPVPTEAPVTTPAPPTTAATEVFANAFGQCTAFSGRSQPGHSQAWQRLYDTAGGDIEGYCADILAGRGGAPASDELVEQPSGERSDDSDPGSRAEATHNGHGRGDGKINSGGAGPGGR